MSEQHAAPVGAESPAPPTPGARPGGPPSDKRDPDPAGNGADNAGDDEVEETPEGEAPPEKKEEIRRAQLTREHAALGRKQREFKREREAFEKERAALQQQRDSLMRARAEAKKNPRAWLEGADLSYDDVTRAFTDAPASTKGPPDDLRREMDERLSKFDQQLREREEAIARQQTEYNERIFVDRIKRAAEADPDRYEFVREHAAESEVYRYMDLHYQKTGEVLDINDALQAAEEMLEQQAFEQYERARKSKKLARRLSPGADGDKPKSEAGSTPQETPAEPAPGKPPKSSLTRPAAPRAQRETDPEKRWEAIKQQAAKRR